MPLFCEPTNNDYFRAVFRIVFGVRRALYSEEDPPGGEPTEHACVGLFRTGDLLFDFMIDPTCTPIDNHGHRMIYAYSLSEWGESVLNFAHALLKQHNIIIGDLKMCTKPYTKDFVRDKIQLNGAGFDAPEYELPAKIARRDRHLAVTDASGKMGRILYDFTAWFGVEVSYPPITEK